MYSLSVLAGGRTSRRLTKAGLPPIWLHAGRNKHWVALQPENTGEWRKRLASYHPISILLERKRPPVSVVASPQALQVMSSRNEVLMPYDGEQQSALPPPLFHQHDGKKGAKKCKLHLQIWRTSRLIYRGPTMNLFSASGSLHWSTTKKQ